MNYIDGLDRVYVGDLKFNRKLQFQWPETADVDGLASVQYPDASTVAGPFEYAGSRSSDDDRPACMAVLTDTLSQTLAWIYKPIELDHWDYKQFKVHLALT